MESQQEKCREKSDSTAAALPIRRERLSADQLVHIIFGESDRIGLRLERITIESHLVSVFHYKEHRNVVNIGDNIIIYGLYYRVRHEDDLYREARYRIAPISPEAVSYFKKMGVESLVKITPKQVVRAAILIETYCRLHPHQSDIK